MPQVVPIYFAPDLDNAWSVSPGALSAINALAPLQSGVYGSIGTANYFGSSTLTSNDHLHAQTFRQVNGTVRFLTFRATDIDEYSSSAVRTNRGTGYNASTTGWSAAAWGNQIIACNKLDATQSSTGAGFTSLAGAPKARHVAANLKFVMLADVDDGSSFVYEDGVAWCALQNPASWTPSIATQAGNIRILDAPGPIRAHVAFGDQFVVFKDNSIHVMDYVGPDAFIFRERPVSTRVGCIAKQSVVELDGKLYFLHSSGFWEYDGQNLRNVGVPVHQTFLSQANYISGGIGGGGSVGGATANPVTSVQASADDIEGVVWWLTTYSVTLTGAGYAVLYGYNARSQKWGAHLVQTTASGTVTSVLVKTVSADMQAFKADATGRFWMVWNDTSTANVRSMRYPVSTTDSSVVSFSTGVFGSNDGSSNLERMHHATLNGTTDDSGLTVSVTGYTSENRNKTNGSVSATVNTELDVADVSINSRYRLVSYAWSAGKKVLIRGLAPEYQRAKR